MGLLEGKVAIVTGGGGGLGRGIAEKFVKEGAKVIIADFAEEVGQKTAGEIKAEFVKVDVTKRADWEAVLKAADEKFGKVDIVINNAGTTYRNKVISISTRVQNPVLTITSLATTLQMRTLTRSWRSMSSRSTIHIKLSCRTCRRRAMAEHS